MAKISGIYVEIKGDATQLKQELKTAKAAVSEQAQGMSKALGGAFSSTQISSSIKKLTSDLSTLSNHSKLSASALKNMSVDLGGLQRVTGLSAAEFGRLQTKLLQTSAANAQERALRSIAKAADLSAGEVKTLGKQMGVSAASIDKVNASSSRASGSVALLGSAAKAALAYLSADAMIGFGRSVFDAGIALDSLQRSFVAIAGSQSGAADFISYLRGESDRLGQSFYDLGPAFKSISAAARGTALEGEPVRKVFSAIAEASTALGMSTADTEGALRALGQMMSKGNVQAEELRGQLGERLPGAFQFAAKAMGVSTAELNKMLQRGEVLATDLLPRLAEEIHKAYGAAAQTAALESGQAAVNRLSGAWEDFKASLYYSDPAVAGINAITAALKELSNEANSLSKIRNDMFQIGETMSSPAFLAGDREKRLQMLNMAGANSFRGKVNRGDVRSGSVPIPAATVADVGVTGKAADTSTKSYAKMIEDGRKAAEVLDQYWNDYEDGRVKAVVEGLTARESATSKDLALVSEFADKYKEVVLGETDFKMAQIAAQADAYRTAGVDEVAVASWAAAEKLKLSREWSDGARLSLAEYADSATNAAQLAQDAITNGFRGMEDAFVSFVKTGKMNFSDLADSIISDLARIAAQKAIAGLIGLIFGGGASSAAGFGIAGELSSFMSLNAKGNVFDSPGLHAYANSVVDKPTMFPFARGAGLMGEAGPEAIMPLKRGPDGTLGVRGGGGSNIVINQIQAPGRGGEVQQRQENGVQIIDLFVEQIESKIAGNISQGRGVVPQAIQRTYGLNRAPGAY